MARDIYIYIHNMLHYGNISYITLYYSILYYPFPIYYFDYIIIYYPFKRKHPSVSRKSWQKRGCRVKKHPINGFA